MNNSSKAITAVAAVVLLTPALLLFIYNIAYGEKTVIERAKANPETACVEDPAWMAKSHMQLLDDWRDQVTREGAHDYVSQTGKRWENMQLTDTCMKCHAKEAKENAEKDPSAGIVPATYCNDCHDYAGINPYCMDCHLDPSQEKTQ